MANVSNALVGGSETRVNGTRAQSKH
jgi:hypothetical protein